MKRIIALCLVVIFCLALTVGCKKKSAATAPTAPTGPTIPGQSQTSGNWTVFVPEGWTLVANENNPEQIYLCKGGTDLNTTPYIKLTKNSTLPAEGTCTNVQPIDAQTYGDLSWSGFSGQRNDHPVIYLVAGDILATLWYQDAALSLEDTAVQTLLGSVTFATEADTEPEPPTSDSDTEHAVSDPETPTNSEESLENNAGSEPDNELSESSSNTNID